MSDDPYLLPHSTVLRNRFGVINQEELDRKEANVVVVRSTLLQANPLKGNFDKAHLKAIHHFLFQDVFDWAGAFRTISLLKRDLVGGMHVTAFAPPESIEYELKELLDKLAQDGFLKGLPRKQFAAALARLFGEINRIHPFREGNGRAQREFVRQLARAVGYPPHFEVVSKERLVQASILSAHGDFSMMERVMDEITDTERIQAVAKVIEHFGSHGFSWNDRYLATTTPGESYSGTFAGSDGTHFFFYDSENRILVGRVKDLQGMPKSKEKVTFTAT